MAMMLRMTPASALEPPSPRARRRRPRHPRPAARRQRPRRSAPPRVQRAAPVSCAGFIPPTTCTAIFISTTAPRPSKPPSRKPRSSTSIRIKVVDFATDANGRVRTRSRRPNRRSPHAEPTRWLTNKSIPTSTGRAKRRSSTISSRSSGANRTISSPITKSAAGSRRKARATAACAPSRSIRSSAASTASATSTASSCPASGHTAGRWKNVDRAYYQDVRLPPVQLYKVGDVYFVKDGNHRVSVARERGVEFIDAEVIEGHVRVPLYASMSPFELLHAGRVRRVPAPDRPRPPPPRPRHPADLARPLRRNVGPHPAPPGVAERAARRVGTGADSGRRLVRLHLPADRARSPASGASRAASPAARKPTSTSG